MLTGQCIVCIPAVSGEDARQEGDGKCCDDAQDDNGSHPPAAPSRLDPVAVAIGGAEYRHGGGAAPQAHACPSGQSARAAASKGP